MIFRLVILFAIPIFIVISPFISFGQKDYSEFTSTFFVKPLTNKIKYTVEKGNLNEICIEFKSDRLIDDEIYLVVKNKQLNEFKQYIEFAKQKFIEWKESAIANNVKEINKEIKPPFKNTYSAIFRGSELFYDGSVKLSAVFGLNAEKFYLIIFTDELVANTNRFITRKQAYLMFGNEQEIDDLLSKLNLSLFEEKIKIEKEKSDLFR